MSQITDRRTLDFLLFEVERIQTTFSSERFRECDRGTITSMLDTAQSVAEELYLPIASKLDANEPAFDGHRVHMIPEVREALQTYSESGFFAAGMEERYGGLQLPAAVTLAISGIFSAANIGIANYHFLSTAAMNLISVFADDELKSLVLPKMMEGRWFGTMCLSEPQAGSSLSDITTTASLTEDGRYSIRGTKMWISGGEHELSENIVHLVLARLPDGPPGVKGISLFLVPKLRWEDGEDDLRFNHIVLAGLNHKMGQRGTVNTALNFGEGGECLGYLIGEPHKGLSYMFQMMNEARIGVGYGATMSGLAGLLVSRAYAMERRQGRSQGEKDPNAPQIPIIEHADVRRLLLAQKAFVEGAQSLLIYCAALIDRTHAAEDANERRRLELLLDTLTPVAKSWPAEFCLEANKHAIQVMGGCGYTRDFPVERHYRDNRLNHIHEGTYAIQGLDLLGRKLTASGGEGLEAVLFELRSTIFQAAGFEELSLERHQLQVLTEQLRNTVNILSGCSDQKLKLANATLFLEVFGQIIVGWIWLRQGIVSLKALSEPNCQSPDFYAGKLKACRYFYRYELPKSVPLLKLVGALDDTTLSCTAEELGA